MQTNLEIQGEGQFCGRFFLREIQGVEFTYDNHTQTFLSTLYIKIVRTARTVQRVKRSKVGLIVNGPRVQIQILDAVLQHLLPMADKLLEGRPHCWFLMPARRHQLVSVII